MTTHTLLEQVSSAPSSARLRDSQQISQFRRYLPQSPQFPSFAKSTLQQYLHEDIFPRIAPPPYGDITIENLSCQKPVYLFREDLKGITVVGKLFKDGFMPLEEAWICAQNEYDNLDLFRSILGKSYETYHVVEPLGKNKNIFAMLVTEKAPGNLLDYYIEKATYERQSQQLYDKLSDLARFFVKLHSKTDTDRYISSDLAQKNMSELLDYLSEVIIACPDKRIIDELACRWWNKDSIFKGDREVIVHGDATPTNFFINENHVVGIDLERVRMADRCWDLGFIVAELKHHFMLRIGDHWAAEPFIGHFLWEYTVNYGDTTLFNGITRRIPIYMALGLLRIAKNDWLSEPYRRLLIGEATRCLRYGL